MQEGRGPLVGTSAPPKRRPPKPLHRNRPGTSGALSPWLTAGRTARCGSEGSGTCPAEPASRRGPPQSHRGSLQVKGGMAPCRGRGAEQPSPRDTVAPSAPLSTLCSGSLPSSASGCSPQMMSVASSSPGTAASSVSHTRRNCAALYSRRMAVSTASLPDWTCADVQGGEEVRWLTTVQAARATNGTPAGAQHGMLFAPRKQLPPSRPATHTYRHVKV